MTYQVMNIKKNTNFFAADLLAVLVRRENTMPIKEKGGVSVLR